MTRRQPRRFKALYLIALSLTLTLLPFCAQASAQENPGSGSSGRNPAGPSALNSSAHSPAVDTKTFHLSYPMQSSDEQDLYYALERMLSPHTKIFLDRSQQAMVVQGTADELDLVDKLIQELDRPRKSYRLTYTVTELDGGKTVSTEHYATILTPGQKGSLKEGDKVPVATGSYSNGSTETQFTYLDVGMNIDSTIEAASDGFRLQVKVERSSLSQPVTISNVQEPVVHQRLLDTTSLLILDKPVMLGSMDVPGSTHRIDIAAVIEPNK